MQAFIVVCLPVIGLGHINAFLLPEHQVPLINIINININIINNVIIVVITNTIIARSHQCLQSCSTNTRRGPSSLTTTTSGKLGI